MVYLGSKRSISKPILDKIEEIDGKNIVFFDPFCGGCHMTKEAISRGYETHSSDKNMFLIEMWKHIQMNGFDGLPEHMTKEEYDEQKYLLRDYLRGDIEDIENKPLLAWCQFMMTRQSAGFWAGYCGNPHKDGRDYVKEHIDSIKKFVASSDEWLSEVNFHVVGDGYRDMEAFILEKLNDSNGKRIVVYCDIPYDSSKGYDIDKNFDYDSFYEWCVKMTECGCSVYVSEFMVEHPRFQEVWCKSYKMTTGGTFTKDKVQRLYHVK